VPEKMIGTLILSNLKSVHTPIKLKNLCKSYSVATLEALEALPSNNYIRVVAFRPDLWAASFHNAREFSDYSSAIKLLLLLILTKQSYPISKPLLPY
jgi:hypothetical protein